MAKKKNVKWTKPRHKIITALARLVLKPIVQSKFNIKIEKFKEQGKRQYLIIGNHQTSFDQFFVSLMFKGPIYYIATEDIFSIGFVSKLLRYAVAPIPIKKQVSDIGAVLNCIKIAKEGGTVALFPEGNRTYNGKTLQFKSAIIGLVKMLKLPLAIVRIEGGYGAQPRWSKVIRKGPVRSYVSKVIEFEEYNKLDNDQLYELISKELFVDEAVVDYDYKHKKLAEYLERAMYVCPHCGLSEFESHNDVVTCKKCGAQVRYLPSKEFKGVNTEWPFRFVDDWYQYQQDYIRKLDLSSFGDKYLYEDKIELREVILYKKKKKISKNAKIRIYNNKYEIEFKKEKLVLDFSDVSVVTVLGQNKVQIYWKDKIYQLKGSERMNALKFMNIYYHKKNIDEGVSEHGFLGI